VLSLTSGPYKQLALTQRNSIIKRFIALAALGVFALPVTANAQHKFVYRADYGRGA
jgi:hypothetical protein